MSLIDTYIKEINLTEVHQSGTSTTKGLLNMGENVAVLSHELGHNIDAKYNVAYDKDLNQIYTEEMNSFKNIYTEEVQDVVKYFSQIGGGDANNGINEFIAETGIIFTTYGSDVTGIESRSEYIIKYFPKTIAKLASIMGY